jgi:hypothetical protein
MILRRKIMKNTSVSKEYSAAEGGKNLFARPLPKYYLARSARITIYATAYLEKATRKPRASWGFLVRYSS